MGVEDAIVHLDDALDALTMQGWRDGERIPPLEATIAHDLERIGKHFGNWGTGNPLCTAGELINQAVIAIVAAKQSLEGANGG